MGCSFSVLHTKGDWLHQIVKEMNCFPSMVRRYYSPKSSACTWLLHFNSLLTKLTIYYCACRLRSEKMNRLLIRVAQRGHWGETTHSPAISVNGALLSARRPGQCQVRRLDITLAEYKPTKARESEIGQSVVDGL